MWVHLRSDSAVPDVATFACVNASVHPEPSSNFPSTMRCVFSTCRSPNVITILSSRYRSGQVHRICFAIANKVGQTQLPEFAQD